MKRDIDDLPLDSPGEISDRGERAYTYRPCDVLGQTRESMWRVVVAVLLCAAGSTLLGTGFRSLRSSGLLGVALIATGVLAFGFGGWMYVRRSKDELVFAERYIRVWYGRRVIEFVGWTFATGFVGTWKAARYECPVDEVLSIDWFSPPDPGVRYSHVRIKTRRGMLYVSDTSRQIEPLRQALAAIVGERRPAFWGTQWFVAAVIMVIVAAVLALCWKLLK